MPDIRLGPGASAFTADFSADVGTGAPTDIILTIGGQAVATTSFSIDFSSDFGDGPALDVSQIAAAFGVPLYTPQPQRIEIIGY